ncbi:c-type cytochrome [Catenovulum sp. SX2]|uniref:c-type cytochrome n=1 Tax=Catenovulum sp. SX2 TaxID=3398614 RepID=UPI003F83D313
MKFLRLGCWLFVAWPMALFANGEDPTPNLNKGAEVYYQRCSLCHGSAGMGDGLLPIKLKNYPNTNLMKPKYPTDRETVHKIIVYGGSLGYTSNLMPPMGNDLTWTQIESVVNFVLLLRQDQAKANALLAKLPDMKKATKKVGQEVFSSRCQLCHGKYGEGDGRMAKVIKNPPPADLTASRVPDDYLRLIITKGGQGVGRSGQMPPWGDQLNGLEIESVILYLQSIRD